MKFINRSFSLAQIIMVVAIIGILTMLAQPAFAQNVYQPNFYRSDTSGFPLTLSNAQSAVVSGTAVTVRQNTGLSLFVKVVSTNTSATSETLGFDVTYDGTNGTTTHPILFTVSGAYSGTNTYWTNFPASFLSNVRTIKPTFATNNATGAIAGSNSLTTRLIWSYSNQ